MIQRTTGTTNRTGKREHRGYTMTDDTENNGDNKQDRQKRAQGVHHDR